MSKHSILISKHYLHKNLQELQTMFLNLNQGITNYAPCKLSTTTEQKLGTKVTQFKFKVPQVPNFWVSKYSKSRQNSNRSKRNTQNLKRAHEYRKWSWNLLLPMLHNFEGQECSQFSCFTEIPRDMELDSSISKRTPQAPNRIAYSLQQCRCSPPSQIP